MTDRRLQRRRLVLEVWIVLACRSVLSGVYALVSLIRKATLPGGCATRPRRSTRSQDDRRCFDFIYQVLGIGFALVPVALALYLLSLDPVKPSPLRRLGLDRHHVVAATCCGAWVWLPRSACRVSACTASVALLGHHRRDHPRAGLVVLVDRAGADPRGAAERDPRGGRGHRLPHDPAAAARLERRRRRSSPARCSARQLSPLPGSRPGLRQLRHGTGVRLLVPPHQAGAAAGHRPHDPRRRRLRRLPAARRSRGLAGR